MAKLKPLLTPQLQKYQLEWEDVQPALELVDSVEELRAAVNEPEAFVKQLMEEAVGPVAIRFAKEAQMYSEYK